MLAFHFGDADRPLLGVYHPPRGERVRDRAVLICPPAALEYIRSHWAMRQLASALARAGFPVLRFDYSGTGDSWGEFTDGSLRLWQADAAAAARELSDNAGMKKMVVVGLRLGAAVAALAFQNLACEQLILWDPVVRGSEYLATLRALDRKRADKWNYPPPPPPPPPPETGVAGEEILGFAFPRRLIEELEGLDLADAASPKRSVVLVLCSAANDRAEELVERWSGPTPAATGRFEYRCVPDRGGWDDLAQVEQALLAPKLEAAVVAAIETRIARPSGAQLSTGAGAGAGTGVQFGTGKGR